MTFVVDASFAAAWCFEDEATEATRAFLDIAGDGGVYVPQIWKFEMANLLRMAERRQRLEESETDAHLKNLAELVVLEDSIDAEKCWKQVMTIAREHLLTVYDASYIELALRIDVPLATRDKAMIAAAHALKIKVLEA